MDKNICPNCGNDKNPWFALCWNCSENEKQEPKRGVFGIEVQEGHTLCKPRWKEKFEDKKQLQSIDFVKTKKEIELNQKFEGKFYFNSQKVRSKSELLICYFLTTNGIIFQYEPLMTLDKEIHPDFVIDDQKGNTIIIQYFGMDDERYFVKKELKEISYKKLCTENECFFFVSTDENDMYNLKDRLSLKLNQTPLKKAIWK